jgi:hypothetical protein
VDDALRSGGHVEQPDAFIATIALERREHILGHYVEKRAPLIPRRHDVVDCPNRPLRKPHAPAARAQHVKRLRGRHLVDEMQPDEQLRLPVGQLPHRVGIPHFLQQRLRHGQSR